MAQDPYNSTPNWGSVQSQLQQGAQQHGVSYDPTDLENVKTSYANNGGDISQHVNSVLDQYQARSGNGPNNTTPSAPGGAPTATPQPSGPQSAQQQSMPSMGSVNPPVYHPNAMPNIHMTQYQPGQVTQFQAPNNSAIQSGTQGLVQHLLDNPLSMNDTVVNQMKEKQKEDAIAMQSQQQQMAQQNAAQRGVVNGGAAAAGQRRSMDALVGSVLNSNRQVDIAKATQDNADMTNAANVGQGYLTNSMANAALGYNTGLGGQQAQFNQNYLVNQSQNNSAQFDMGNFFNNEGLRQAEASSGQSALAQQLAMQQFMAQLNYQYQNGAMQNNLGYAQLAAK